MRFPLRLLRSRWPDVVERRLGRFLWDDPSVITRDDVTPAAFRDAMKAIHVGGTYKITGKDRHGPADALLVDHVDLSGASIVDMGASDGSTSVDLVERVPDFASYVIADLYLSVQRVRSGSRTVFFAPDGTCVLVVGRRLLAWPGLSPVMALMCLPTVRRARRSGAALEEVLLLNPETRRLMARDPRVSYAVHDVFEPWPGPSPDVIKVANLLRRLYFSDEDICRALRSLLASLDEGGHLLILDNPRIPGIDIRAGLFRRVQDHFELVATTTEEPEILDLVLSPGVRTTR